jgi:DNA processing protein
MNDLKYWIWLSRIDNISSLVLLNLIKRYKTPNELWNKTKEQLILDGINKNVIEKIINLQYRKNLDKYIEYMNKNKIEIITYFDNEYPYRLKEIYDPPIVLFLKGNKNILNNYGLSIIGCRQASLYGENVAKNLAYNLGINNINVISGLARGIDSCAHIGCLKAKGLTIAVVGCGLDIVYPNENKNLFNQIISSGGAVISEYVVGTKPIAKNFPARNRIISGISEGIIVVEAKQKSGTLITVDFALEQGKEIYAVPGNITSKNSYGTNELIKQGAKIITDFTDIFI